MAQGRGWAYFGAMVQLEVCVDTLSGVAAAKAGGAARVELCAALSEGGLTPSFGLMQSAARIGLPCVAMIRPRAGLFAYSEAELSLMIDDIGMARSAGMVGVVIGAQGAEGKLDLGALRRLREAAGTLETCLHRVIDVVPDPMAALDQAIGLGFDRVLTSGGGTDALAGADRIAEMVRRADGRISVMVGAGVTPENVGALVARTGVGEVHSSCSVQDAQARGSLRFDPPAGRRRTDGAMVARMVTALSSVEEAPERESRPSAPDDGEQPVIEILYGLDHIRKRPAMYLGDTGRGGAAELVRSAVDVLAALTVNREHPPLFYYRNHAFLDVSVQGEAVQVVIDYHPEEAPDLVARCRSLAESAENPAPDAYALDRSVNSMAPIAVLAALSRELCVTRDGETILAFGDPGPMAVPEVTKGDFVAARFRFGEALDTGDLTGDFLEGVLHGNRISGLVLRTVTVT